VKKIIILAGFSASGKDTIARLIEKNGAHFIISNTTRPMRDYEDQGNPYWFITEKEFLDMADKGEFIEHRKYNTLLNNIPEVWHYGVHKNEVKNDMLNVVVLDMMGVREFKEYFGDRCIVFFINASEEERRRRCRVRGDYDSSEFERRLEDDKKQFPMEVIKQEVDYIIESTGADENVEEIFKIIKENDSGTK